MAAPSQVFILCTTSRLDCVDSNLLGPDALAEMLTLKPLTELQHAEILEKKTRKLKNIAGESRNQVLCEVAKRAHGLLPADLEAVVSEACLEHSRRGGDLFSMPPYECFAMAIDRVTPPSLKSLKVALKRLQTQGDSSKQASASSLFEELKDDEAPIDRALALLDDLGGLFRAARIGNLPAGPICCAQPSRKCWPCGA